MLGHRHLLVAGRGLWTLVTLFAVFGIHVLVGKRNDGVCGGIGRRIPPGVYPFLIPRNPVYNFLSSPPLTEYTMHHTNWAEFISKLNYIHRLGLLNSDMLVMFTAMSRRQHRQLWRRELALRNDVACPSRHVSLSAAAYFCIMHCNGMPARVDGERVSLWRHK